MKRSKIIIGTRSSELALTQTNIVIEKFKKIYPEINFEIKKIKTIGDKILDKTLNKIGGKGLFVKEIEIALLKKEIDIAVHSMKDVPSEFPEGLEIGAITEREDVRDVLISKDGKKLAELKEGARIGTSSLRRGAQIKALRNDVVVEPIRGNIQTRINKIDEMNLDGVILAAAGIIRMGMAKHISQFFDIEELVPAVGQGALGLEIRSDDEFIKSMVSKVSHKETQYAVRAERKFMETLNGGCHVPIGAYGFIEDNCMKMVGMAASLDGKKVVRVYDEAKMEDYELLGRKVGEEVLTKGGREILNEIEGDV